MLTYIFIHGPTGPLIFNVDLRMTGFDIKVLIAEKLNIPDKHIWLMYNGKVMYDSTILLDLGIRRDDTIRCYVR